MATAAEVKAKILPRLKQAARTEFVWTDLVAAVAMATAQQKTEIIAGIRGRSREQIGTAVLGVAQLKINADAEAEADTIVADNAIDFTEIDRVL